MRIIPIALAALAVVSIGSGGAEAQISRDGGPVGFSSDDSDGDFGSGRFSLIGRAELTQDDNRLRADRVDLYSNTESGDAERIEAIGNVYFVTPEQVLRGDRAVFQVASNTVVITGDVILSQGKNVMTGSRLTYNVETGQARMEGGQTPGGRRVQGVFYPDQQN